MLSIFLIGIGVITNTARARTFDVSDFTDTSKICADGLDEYVYELTTTNANGQVVFNTPDGVIVFDGGANNSKITKYVCATENDVKQWTVQFCSSYIESNGSGSCDRGGEVITPRCVTCKEPDLPTEIKYTLVYEVTGDLPAGYSIPAGGTYSVGEAVVIAPIPNVDGYDFIGWDTSRLDGGKMPAENAIVAGEFKKREIVDPPYEPPVTPPEGPPTPPPADEPPGTRDNTPTPVNPPPANPTITVPVAFTPAPNVPADTDVVDEVIVAATTPQSLYQNRTSKNSGEVLGARDSAEHWALLNLILAIGTVLASVVLLLAWLGGKAKDDDKGEDNNRHGLLRTLTLVPAAGAVIAFLLTEDWTLPMRFVDVWTWLMIVIAVVQIVLIVFATRRAQRSRENR
jgi:hypothetical protein